jgi:hypothetical protein
MVDIRLESIFDEPLALPLLRQVPGLKRMELLRKGSRLSVQPVTPAEFDIVLGLAAKAEKSTATKTKVTARAPKTSRAQASAPKKSTTKKAADRHGAHPTSKGEKGRRPAAAR